MRKNKPTGNDGFTLIEVILSIAILALITVPLINYFTDSMKHAVKTQEKQNATLMAQNTLEFLKSQEALMRWASSTADDGTIVNHYDVNDNIKTKFNVPLSMSLTDFASAQPAFDKDDGKGTLVYEYTEEAESGDEYDVRVTIMTDTGMSEVSSVVDKIDDTKSVVASEYNEEDTAIMEFMSKNSAAVLKEGGVYVIGVTPEPTETPSAMYTTAPSESPSASPSSGPSYPAFLQTEVDVMNNIRRTVHVDMGMKEGVYTVRVYYEYSCINISNSDPTKPDKVFSADLVNTNVKELDSLYIMFNKVNLTEDKFEFTWNKDGGVENPPAGVYPDIRLICQDLGVVRPTGTPDPDNPDAVVTVDPATVAYTPSILFKGFSGWSLWNPKIRTNLGGASGFVYDSSSDVGGAWQSPAPLSETGSPVRVFKMTVEVFRKGERDVAGSTPIVSMITSKAE